MNNHQLSLTYAGQSRQLLFQRNLDLWEALRTSRLMQEAWNTAMIQPHPEGDLQDRAFKEQARLQGLKH